MNLLVVIFGGVDHTYLDRLPCPNLKQAEWGPVVVDQLHDQRDVASQITAQFITGQTWRENGVLDRKKDRILYRKPALAWLETSRLGRIKKGRLKRHRVYQALGWADIISREYLRTDLTSPSIFDEVSNSKAVYVPAYNPEPSWALSRNILDPQRYPDLGVEGALDLLEKNFQWRREALLQALADPPYSLLMAQFQYVDSAQHLYLSYHDPPRNDLVDEAYHRIDAFAGELLEKADGRYGQVLFVSDNGAARTEGGTRPTHHNRPFYSVKTELGLGRPNIRDFHRLMLEWTNEADLG